MDISRIGAFLKDPTRPLKARFRALHVLKNLNTVEAVNLIADCFTDESDLLKHELAYCLGQMGREEAIPILEKLIKNKNNNSIVRHEAGEALAAIGTDECTQIVAYYVHDVSQDVAETCILALSRIGQAKDIREGRIQDPYGDGTPVFFSSIDPAFPLDETTDVKTLGEIATDEDTDMYLRYAALFKLRNLRTTEAVLELAKSLNCKKSALFRHEVAFILGQMQDEASFDALLERLADTGESAMVRHECAESIGAIGTPECKSALEKYLDDPERIVRESVEVALDICEHELNDIFQYANGEEIIKEMISTSKEGTDLPKGT